MKRNFVLLLVLFFAATIFANVRMDSMLLQNGELKDVIGDYLYSPTFVIDKPMVIYFGNADDIYSNENNVFNETNNWIDTNYAKITEDNYSLNLLAVVKLKNYIFGFYYDPIFQNFKDDTLTKRYFKGTSSYFTNEETITTIKSALHQFDFTGGLDLGKFNVGLKLGIVSGKTDSKNNFFDYLDSGNNVIEGSLIKQLNVVLSPDVLFKLSFGKILASFNITSISNSGDENFDGNNYLSNYKETGVNFMPKLFYNNIFSFGEIRFGFNFGTENLKREYTYSPSLQENTFDYSNKTNGVTLFVTLTKTYKHSLITGGFRAMTSNIKNSYIYDNDTTNTAYVSTAIESKSNNFGLIFAFEHQLTRIIKIFSGINWNVSNNVTENILKKDETGAVLSNDTEKFKTPDFNYGLGISFRLWNIGSLNVSFSNLAKGFGNLDDKIDELALNNIDTTNEKRFTIYFDFLR